MVSTNLINISQMGNLPQIGVKIKNVWNHHLVLFRSPLLIPFVSSVFLNQVNYYEKILAFNPRSTRFSILSSARPEWNDPRPPQSHSDAAQLHPSHTGHGKPTAQFATCQDHPQIITTPQKLTVRAPQKMMVGRWNVLLKWSHFKMTFVHFRRG